MYRPWFARPACEAVWRRTLAACAAAFVAGVPPAALSATPSATAAGEEEDLAQAYGDKLYLSIATGSPQPVRRAPAVASVITADDIAAMGAIDVDEVLESVPGLHVARQPIVYSPSYVIRGINLGYNPQVLMLVNGVPLTTVFTGNRGNGWVGLPVDDIARIEVIRGPGSALYGADAFAGVINIITKKAADIGGTEVGLRAGSFKSNGGWLLHGGRWGEADVATYLHVGTTEGARSLIGADAQTALDRLTGTSASRAPGPVDNQRDFVDAAVDVGAGRWRWRAAYRERNVGSGAGVASALDPTGSNHSRFMSSDLNFEDNRSVPDWSFIGQFSAMQYKESSDLVLFPPGVLFGPPGPFTDGMIGRPAKWERSARLNLAAVYAGWQRHRVRLGAGVERQELYRVRESKNYRYTPALVPIGTGSLADVVDVSDTEPFLQPHGRTNRYVYLQDEWSFASDWTLTAGLRQDRYSDFGSTTNPRLALVWDAAYDLTAKLMFGTAFRAPSMTELYAINNPVITGNAGLKPESIRTAEAALTWQASAALQLQMNVFHYQARDIIRAVGGAYGNAGEQAGRGLELEATWEPRPTWRLAGNYSFQRATDRTTGQDAGNSPRHHAYLRSDWRWMAGWALHGQFNWVGERARVAGDPRAPLAGYRTLDLTLRTDRPLSGWELSLSLLNVFDARGREPSPYDVAPTHPFISLPDDLPLPGRAWRAQASYRF